MSSLVMPKIFLDRQFDGQAMRIPARFAQYQFAFHGLETAESVFDRTSQDVVDTRFAIGGRGPFKKYKARAAFSLAHAFFKNLVFFPESEHFFVYARQV
jgi:hypothetical protein